MSFIFIQDGGSEPLCPIYNNINCIGVVQRGGRPGQAAQVPWLGGMAGGIPGIRLLGLTLFLFESGA